MRQAALDRIKTSIGLPDRKGAVGARIQSEKSKAENRDVTTDDRQRKVEWGGSATRLPGSPFRGVLRLDPDLERRQSQEHSKGHRVFETNVKRSKKTQQRERERSSSLSVKQRHFKGSCRKLLERTNDSRFWGAKHYKEWLLAGKHRASPKGSWTITCQ